MPKECKEGKCSHIPHCKFIGLRMGRDSWWMFIGQVTSQSSVKQAFNVNQSLDP